MKRSVHADRIAKAMLLGGAGLLALMTAAPVAAQTSAAQTSTVSSATGDTGGEVVVVAQRRSEVLEKVPMSVSVVSAATVQRSGVESIHELNQIVAGASVSFAGCCSQPAIRGVSTLTTGVGFENNVAIYVDGFYVPDNLSVNGDLANISEIEVLKGPQGALWGRNATGGAILINTLDPSKTLTGDLEAGYGDFNEITTKAYLSGPIDDRIGFSVSEASRTSNGYNKWIGPNGKLFSNSLTPITQFTLRTKLKIEVTSNLTATVAYNHADSDDARGEVFEAYNHLVPFVEGLPTDPYGSTPGAPFIAKGPYEGSPYQRPIAAAKVDEWTMKLVWNTPIGDLTSTTGYALRLDKLTYDFDNTFAGYIGNVSDYGDNTFQQSLIYNITAVPHLDLILGSDFYNDNLKVEYSNDYTGAGQVLLLQDHGLQQSQAYAFYFDGTYHLTDKLSLDFGGRYTHDQKTLNVSQNMGIVPTLDFAPASATAGFQAFTPKVSLRYQLAHNTDVYVSYSQGYRTGGFSLGVPLDPTPFQPESIDAYEVGFKTNQSWYQFNSAVFYYNYNNMQVGIVESNGPNLIDVTENAKAAVLYGWDNDFTVQPMAHMNIRGGFLLEHATYTNFNNAQGTGLCAVPTIVPGTTTPCIVGTNVAEEQNLTGKQMIRAPDVSGFLGGDYEFENVFGGSLDVALNATYTDAAPTENASVFGPADPAQAGRERYVSGAYTLLNGQITWKDPSGHYKVTLWGNNLTNTQYRIVVSGAAVTGDFQSFGEPLSFGGRVGYSF
jgi:iron complex outermembrane recepter protein